MRRKGEGGEEANQQIGKTRGLGWRICAFVIRTGQEERTGDFVRWGHRPGSGPFCDGYAIVLPGCASGAESRREA